MKKIEQWVRPNIRQLKPYSSARNEFSGEASVCKQKIQLIIRIGCKPGRREGDSILFVIQKIINRDLE